MADGTSVGSIYYDLDLDSKKFEANLASADAKAKGFASQLGNQFEKSTQASQAFAGGLLAVGAGVLAAGGAALKSAGDYQQNAVAFEVMLGSASKAQGLLKQISDFAASTPFELPAVVEGSKKLLAFGVAGDDVISTFRMLGNIAAAVGTEKLPGLINVFGQVKAAGRLMSQDLLQFTSAGVPIIDMLAQHFGVAKDKIKDMVEQGKVSFPDLQASLAQLGGPGGKWADLMDRQSKTLQGTLSNVSDSLGRVARAVVGMDAQGNIKEGSIFAQATDAINKLLGFLTAHQQDIINFFNSTFGFIAEHGPVIIGIIAGGLAPAFIALAAAALSGLAALAPYMIVGVALALAWEKSKLLFFVLAGAIAGFALGIVIFLWPAIWGSVTAFAALAIAVIAATWPFILAGALIAGAAYLIVTHWSQISKFFGDLWKAVTKWFTQAGTDIGNAVDGMVKWVQGIPGWFSKVWTSALNGIGRFISDAGTFFKNLPMQIIEAIGWIIGRFIRFELVDLPNFYIAVIGWFIQLPGAIWNILVSMYNAVSTWFVNSFNAAVGWTANAINAVGAWFAALPGIVWNAVVGAYNTIVGWFGNMYNASRNAGANIVNGFGSFINGLPGMVGGIFNSVVNTIMSFGQRLWDMAKQVAGSFWQGFKKGLGISSPSYVERAFMAIGKQSTDTLGQMKDDIGTLQGLGNNLMTMPKSLVQANGSITLGNNSAKTGDQITYQIGSVELTTKEATETFFSIGNRNTQLESLGGSPLPGTSGV